MGSRLTTKTGSKDIVKAADDFTSKVGSGKAVDKDKIHRSKGEINSFNKKHRRSKARAREIPTAIPREKKKATQTDKTDGTGPKKVVTLARPGGRIQAKMERETREKVVRKGQTTATRRQPNKEASKVTFTDVERLFMKLMKGANEEDWNCLVNFERDGYARSHVHKIRSVYNAESLPWT